MMTSPGRALTGNMASKMSIRSFSSRCEKSTFFPAALASESIVRESLGTTCKLLMQLIITEFVT